MNSSMYSPTVSAMLLPEIDPDPCDETNNFFEALGCITGSQGFIVVIYIIGGVLSCCACVAYCHKKCVRKRIKNLYALCLVNLYPNDDTQPLKLVYLAFSFIDYMTDCAWAIDVIGEPVDQIWKILAVLGVVVPYIVNLLCAAWFLRYLKQNRNYQTQSDQWIKVHSGRFLIAVALTGNGEPVLQLFNSKICNLSLFSMNLRHKILYYRTKWSAVILNCMIEKLPQFIIQIMFFEEHSTIYGQVTVIAILFSSIGLLLTFFQLLNLICINNQFREERIELTFYFDGNNNNYNGGAPLCLPAISNNVSAASNLQLPVNNINKSNNNINNNNSKQNSSNGTHNGLGSTGSTGSSGTLIGSVGSRGQTKSLSKDTEYHKIIDQVFGLSKYITQNIVTKNFNFAKYSLVCQFVEPNFSHDYVKMMFEVLTDDEYKQNKLTNKYLNNQLKESKILINGMNKLISKIYVHEFGGASQTLTQLSPVKVHKIEARIISSDDSVNLANETVQNENENDISGIGDELQAEIEYLSSNENDNDNQMHLQVGNHLRAQTPQDRGRTNSGLSQTSNSINTSRLSQVSSRSRGDSAALAQILQTRINMNSTGSTITNAVEKDRERRESKESQDEERDSPSKQFNRNVAGNVNGNQDKITRSRPPSMVVTQSPFARSPSGRVTPATPKTPKTPKTQNTPTQTPTQTAVTPVRPMTPMTPTHRRRAFRPRADTLGSVSTRSAQIPENDILCALPASSPKILLGFGGSLTVNGKMNHAPTISNYSLEYNCVPQLPSSTNLNNDEKDEVDIETSDNHDVDDNDTRQNKSGKEKDNNCNDNYNVTSIETRTHKISITAPPNASKSDNIINASNLKMNSRPNGHANENENKNENGDEDVNDNGEDARGEHVVSSDGADPIGTDGVVPPMHSASDAAAASSASCGSTNSPDSAYSNKMWINRDKQSNSFDASVITNKNDNNNNNDDGNNDIDDDDNNENDNGNGHHNSGHRARNGGLQCDPDTDNTATISEFLHNVLSPDG